MITITLHVSSAFPVWPRGIIPRPEIAESKGVLLLKLQSIPPLCSLRRHLLPDMMQSFFRNTKNGMRGASHTLPGASLNDLKTLTLKLH